MSLIKSLLFTLLLAAAAVQASTRDEIERLWNPQGMAAQPAQPAAGTSARTEKPAPRWFRLSNGRQVNLADWKVVLFMQGHCPYCHQFDPVLKQLAQQYGFSVFPYTLDGQGDTAFPEALPVPPDVMQTFFPNIPVTKNINIMWNALSKNRMFDGNKELKEFVMTLTGSLVFGPNGEITPLSARTTDRSIIRAMMEGGTAKIYHCNDSDKCLKVVADTPVTISRDNALKSQITKLLASIQNKAVSDTPLDDKEKGFISSTTIPVFKYLVDPQMLGVSNSMIYQLTDYIGYDILLQYIQELIQQARAMVATGNYDEAVIEHINDNMNDATRQIAAFQSQVQVQQDALLVVDRQMSYMRQQLSARMLSRYQNNYHFGGSTL